MLLTLLFDILNKSVHVNIVWLARLSVPHTEHLWLIGCESAAQLEIVTKHLLLEVGQQHRRLGGSPPVVRWKILSKYSHNLEDWNLVLSELLSYLCDYFVVQIISWFIICAIWDLCAKALCEKITIQVVTPQASELWVDSSIFLDRLLLSEHGPLYVQI